MYIFLYSFSLHTSFYTNDFWEIHYLGIFPQTSITICVKCQRSIWDIIGTNLVVLECQMLYSKFQWYRPLGSEEDNFIGFLPYIGLWPDHLNKLASVKSSIRTSTNQNDGSQTTANDLNVYEPQQNLDRRLSTSKTGLSPQKFITDRSKAVLLLWFILIVNVRPLYACLWLSFHFI